jgi:hypothetical protein
VAPTSVTLGAQVNPGMGDTVFLFEFGTSTAYGDVTPPSASIADDTTDHPVSTGLTDLASGTTYHFRAVATNFGGTTLGADQVFTTPAAPVVEPPLPSTSNTPTGNQGSGGGGQEVVKPKKCRKGFVKKHGRCVKKKKHHRKTSRSHG